MTAGFAGDAPGELAGPGDEVTRDALLRGRVTLFQPRKGFRSSLDPVLLAGFLQPPFGHFLDLGCGTGALAFLLLARDEAATGVGVEIQPRLAALTTRAIEVNQVGARFQLRREDVRHTALPPQSFDLVATNPPFQPLGQGDLPPDDERAIAHHEVALTLDAWLDRAVRLCRPDGRIATVFPAARAVALLAGIEARGFSATRFRPVYPRAGQVATRVLLEARRTRAPGLSVEPPLFVHEGDTYSPEVRTFLGEV